MALQFQFSILGKTKTNVVAEFTRKCDDLTPLWKKVAESLSKYQDNIFASEGAFQGLEKWQGLSEPYRTWKAKKYPGKGILELSGRLRNSFQIGGQDNIFEYSKDGMTFGSKRRVGGKYNLGLIHQLAMGRQPERKSLRLSGDQKVKIKQMLFTFMRGGEI